MLKAILAYAKHRPTNTIVRLSTRVDVLSRRMCILERTSSPFRQHSNNVLSRAVFDSVYITDLSLRTYLHSNKILTPEFNTL